MSSTYEKPDSLSCLLDEDRERLASEIEADRSSEHVSKLLEKEVDRLLMRYSQLPAAEGKLPAVQQMLQTARSSLPVVESVSDTEVWRKDQAQGRVRKNPAGLMFMTAGAALTLIPSLFHPGTVICTLTGIGCMFLGGFLLGRGNSKASAEGSGKRNKGTGGGSGSGQIPDRNVKFLVDTDTVLHNMKQITMTIDGILSRMEKGDGATLPSGNAESGASSQVQSSILADGLAPDQLDFFSELLENAYASRNRHMNDRAAGEQIESIRYYLYKRNIGIEDYAGDTNAEYFEFLPAGGGRATIRPALVSGGKLLKRGLASQ